MTANRRRLPVGIRSFSTVFNAIGFRVEMERMLSTGRIDMVVEAERYIYVMELKLSNNGGLKADERQIIDNGCLEPFRGGKRTVVGLDSEGRWLVGWKAVEV